MKNFRLEGSHGFLWRSFMKYIRVENNVGYINIKGDWTLLQSCDLEDNLSEVYGKGLNKFIVDLEGTETIDFASIQVLIKLRTQVGEENVNFINLNPQTKAFLMLKKAHLTGL